VALRDIRLGAFLVPLAVAILPVSVLLWYGLVHIPANQSYLNERNFRLLMTVSGNIRTKVNSFDSAIDHAVESFPVDDGTEKLRQGVHLFAQELDVLQVVLGHAPVSDTGDIEQTMLSEASDPPRIRLDRDEDRTYLYLGAKLDASETSTVRVVARADIGAVVDPFLAHRTEFDALLLASQTGEVIAQQSPIGLGLARVDTLLSSHDQFSSMRNYSNLVPVRIGEVDYKLYVQPLPLSLLSTDKRVPDQWVLCGLVRADRFRVESSALSFATLLWFSAALGAVFLAIPLVKLHALKPRERLRASDAGWVTAATFAAVGLIAIGLLDLGVFGYAFPRAVDVRLSSTADRLEKHLHEEVAQIDLQADQFNSELGGNFEDVSTQLQNNPRSWRLKIDRDRVVCSPSGACRLRILDDPKDGHVAGRQYPYVYLASWIGRDFWQRVKWTPGGSITPFINLKNEQVPYRRDLEHAWQMGPTKATEEFSRGVSVIESPNTGEPLTVFWRAPRVASTDAEKDAASDVKTYAQSLATYSPISLDHPILPRAVSFAVVDRDGRALFHSDPTRSLQENFLKESEDNPGLHSALLAQQKANVSVYYLGRLNRMHVRPLTLSDDDTYGAPGWSLIVFQGSATADAINLETVTIASMLFAAYGLLLALAPLAVRMVSHRRWTKWFWPIAGHSTAYVRSIAVNMLVAMTFIAVTALTAPYVAFIAAVVLAAAAALTTRWLIARMGAQRAPRVLRPAHPFFFARAALLLVTAGLPAIAAFQVAYAFETRLLATSEQIQASKDDQSRSNRIERFVRRFKLRDTNVMRALVASRAKQDWDRDWTPPDSGGVPTLLDPLLAWMHRPYNDVATELSAAGASGDIAPASAPSLGAGWIAAIVVALFCICYAFVYVLVRPLFVLEAATPVPQAERDSDAKYVLEVGPPGSGKSTRLAAYPRIRVFDVTRLGFVERRVVARPVPVERRQVAAAVVGFGPGSGPSRLSFDVAHDAPAPHAPVSSAAWADEFDYGTLPGSDGVLGIDHLDHRLDEREFGAQTLHFLEQVVHRDVGRIRIVCDRDPIVSLQESGAPAGELERWTRALSGFRKVFVPIGRCPSTESADDTFAPFFDALWHACTRDERLTLRQLAEEGLINPQNLVIARQLMRAGLIVRDPVPRLMSNTFRRFVMSAATPDQVSAWERVGVPVPWASIEVAMMTVVIGLAGLLVVTQEQLVGAWIGFVPTLVPAVQRVWSLVAMVRPAAKEAAAAAAG